MQLFALNDDSIPISATRAERQKNYLCPECSARVRLRSGPHRQNHFYHLSHPKPCHQHQKSLEHLQTQLKLLDLIGNEGHIECPFPTLGRIADVAWHAKKIIFEIQCSPITQEEVQNRNQNYQQLGYEVIWILHDRRFNKTYLSASENYLRTISSYFTDIDKRGKGKIYDQFEILKNNKRLVKGPPLPIVATELTPVPLVDLTQLQLPLAISLRFLNRKHYLHGDLLYRLLHEGSIHHSAKQWLALESHFLNPPTTQRLPFPLLLRKSYFSLINALLKKCAEN